MQSIKKIMLIIFLISLASCATALNPYNSKFSCPEYQKGKCVPVKTAYQESKNKENIEKKRGIFIANREPDVKKIYEASLYRKLSKLIEQPETPLLAPPQILRILILQYRDGKNLYMPRHVYTYIDDPLWVIERRKDIKE